MVEIGLTEIHLQVSDHVEHHKTNETNSGNCHHVLFAYSGAVEIEQKRTTLLFPYSGARDGSTL